MAGPTPLGEPGYHPPSFPLFEAVLADGMAQPHRWLLGWNGLVTEPATDVTLAARSADEVALVTSSRWSSELDARLAASSLVAALHPATNGFTPAALRTFAQDDSSWTEAQVRVDGHARRGATATLRGVTVVCCAVGASVVVAASRATVSLRRVKPDGADAYAASPFTSHAYGALPAGPRLH